MRQLNVYFARDTLRVGAEHFGGLLSREGDRCVEDIFPVLREHLVVQTVEERLVLLLNVSKQAYMCQM